MVEIRTFDGDWQQLSDFCQAHWLRRYQGKVPVVLWTRHRPERKVPGGRESGRVG